MKRNVTRLVIAMAIVLGLSCLAACSAPSPSSSSTNTDTRDTMVIGAGAWECVSDPSKVERELLQKAYKDELYHVW